MRCMKDIDAAASTLPSGAGRTCFLGALLAILGGLAPAAQAADAPARADPVFKPYADVRYRLEFVDQDDIARGAVASTLRARAGVKTVEWQGFSAVLEGETIAHVGGARFNDTLNGRTQYPLVADPEDTAINQAYVRWRQGDLLDVVVGRQAINLDNQRWVGSVGWRQNDQTLDAAGVTLKPARGLSFAYNHVWRVNRIYGTDSPQGAFRGNRIHLVRLSQEVAGYGTLAAYDYLLDIPDAPALSSKTLGLRFSGSHALNGAWKLLYAVEYARQSDHGRNPRDFGLDYLLLEPGLAHGAWTLRLGHEELGSNGVVALQTPLATLHAFNGWADKFLTTPVNGLRDVYVDLGYKLGGPGLLKDTSLRLAYHDYRAARGSMHYGRETDLMITHPVGRHLVVLAKYADYRADRYASDTQKIWFALEGKF
jgi:hypothetical protein